MREILYFNIKHQDVIYLLFKKTNKHWDAIYFTFHFLFLPQTKHEDGMIYFVGYNTLRISFSIGYNIQGYLIGNNILYYYNQPAKHDPSVKSKVENMGTKFLQKLLVRRITQFICKEVRTH